jgi:hypothetical protein
MSYLMMVAYSHYGWEFLDGAYHLQSRQRLLNAEKILLHTHHSHIDFIYPGLRKPDFTSIFNRITKAFGI